MSIPTAEEETAYLWNTLLDVPFFLDQGYTLQLPQHPLMDALMDKAERVALQAEDRNALAQAMHEDIYAREDYKAAAQKIRSRTPLINTMISELDAMAKMWRYQSYPSYKVTLTLYGPGGSFDPDQGSLILRTTAEGDFARYPDPACTIIHEVVHIGIEHAIVRRLSLPHGLKERVVDRIVALRFGDVLPAYRVQPMGYVGLDRHLRDADQLAQLPEVLAEYWGSGVEE
ncbi:MAG: hypothetical protein AAF184_17860 [Pseudomonadota bacterium]